eukprot:UN23496
MLINFHLSLTVLFTIDIKYVSFEVDSPIFFRISSFYKILNNFLIK